MSSEYSTNKRTVWLYWQQIRKDKFRFFVALFSVPIAALFIDTLFPYYLSQAIGNISPTANETVTQNILTASVVFFVGILLNLLGYQLLARHEAGVRFRLAEDTFNRLISKDLSFFINEKIGALTSRWIDFISSHVSLQDLIITRTLGFIISISVGLIIVGAQSVWLLIILLILFILIVIQIQTNLKIRTPYRHARKNLIAESNGRVADALTNSLMVKTFANESNELKYLNKISDKIQTTSIKDFSISGFGGSTRIATVAVAQIIAVILCTTLVANKQIELSMAVFILIYLQRISTQLFTLGEMINGYDKLLLAAAPMSDILAQETAVNDKPNAIKMSDINPTINLQNVSYHYDDNKNNVLQDINLSIPSGQKVGLVGHSGAGKTTVTHLLLRFFDVSKGTIKIDNHDVRDVTQESLRKNIAYVPQEPMLFHRTLRENITYGKPNATKEEIIDAAKKANAFEFIDKLPKKFDTTVGERGVKLSGGQRQRIAIARAILKDAPILILDEATSALDSESEKLIQDSLKDLMKGRTSIVIAHRLSTIAKLDRIIVIEDGRVIEDGTHSELLSANKTYAKLWAHQSGGFIEE